MKKSKLILTMYTGVIALAVASYGPFVQDRAQRRYAANRRICFIALDLIVVIFEFLIIGSLSEVQTVYFHEFFDFTHRFFSQRCGCGRCHVYCV